MPERTHPTQQDEALRRVHLTRDERTLAGLRSIAHTLATTRPTDPMAPEDRDRAIRCYILDHHRNDIRTASGTRWDLHDALPNVLNGDTRAEYAARIQLTIRGVQA